MEVPRGTHDMTAGSNDRRTPSRLRLFYGRNSLSRLHSDPYVWFGTRGPVPGRVVVSSMVIMFLYFDDDEIELGKRGQNNNHNRWSAVMSEVL